MEAKREIPAEVEVLYEDNDVAVVNKPAAMVVNRAESVKQATLQDWSEQNLELEIEMGTDEQQNIFVGRSGLAHRLDKDTSGTLAVGKNPEALADLMAQFKSRTVEKEYVALVHGKLSPKEGSVRVPLSRSRHAKQAMGVQIDGKMAETGYRVDSYWGVGEWLEKNVGKYGEGFTLANLYPKTGRTHQIRVHMKHIRHPLVGDKQYVGKKRTKLDAFWCPRHFLHAKSIRFRHPIGGKPVRVEAPLPDDLETVMEKLERIDE